jgi:hypothetical protein
MCRYFDVMGIFFLHSEIWEANLVSKHGLAGSYKFFTRVRRGEKSLATRGYDKVVGVS